MTGGLVGVLDASVGVMLCGPDEMGLPRELYVATGSVLQTDRQTCFTHVSHASD